MWLYKLSSPLASENPPFVRRCIHIGCAAESSGRTYYCEDHGGWSKCTVVDCPRFATERSKDDKGPPKCVKHGGGKRCSKCGRPFGRKRENKRRAHVCTECYYEANPHLKRPGVSRIGCRWIDDVEFETGFAIQHVHFGLSTGEWIGKEHRLLEFTKCCKKVDGWFGPEGVVFEFLGDIFHGHPRLWREDPEATNHFGKKYKRLYDKTFANLHKIKELGYHVVYCWETEYKKAVKAGTSVCDACILI